jgi:hypothetical protein
MADQPWRRKAGDPKRSSAWKVFEEKRCDDLVAGMEAAASEVALNGPYAWLADAIQATVSEALMAALMANEFGAELRDRGFVIVPALPAGQIPEPSLEWLDDALGTARWQQLDSIVALWRTAWQAGWEARQGEQKS